MESNGDRLIKIEEVQGLSGVSRSQVYNLISGNNFPQPINVSKSKNRRSSRWSFNEIQEWIEEKKRHRAAS